MACFLVPVGEAIVTTIAAKALKSREQAPKNAVKAQETTGVPFFRKLNWLSNLLWGGSALLAFEHLWHGELSPVFPFLTAMGNPADTAEMLREMSTVGVAMAAAVTAVWCGMLAVSGLMEKRAPAAPRPMR